MSFRWAVLCWSGVSEEGEEDGVGIQQPRHVRAAIPYSGSENDPWSGGDRAEWGRIGFNTSRKLGVSEV